MERIGYGGWHLWGTLEHFKQIATPKLVPILVPKMTKTIMHMPGRYCIPSVLIETYNLALFQIYQKMLNAETSGRENV